MGKSVSEVLVAVAEGARAASRGGGIERRRDRRYPCRLQLVLSRNGQELAAQTEDVSFTGIFFRTDTPLPERQLVKLRLSLPPGEEPLAVMGMVARNVPARDGLAPGIGIQFYALATADRKRWIHYVREAAASAQAAPVPAPGVAAAMVPEPPPPTSVIPPPLPHPPEPVRRQYPRHAVALQVLLHSVDDLRTFYTRNVSKGGLFVATTLDVAEGTDMRVSVIHPKSHERFTLAAVVRRRGDAGDPGLGLEFAALDEVRREEFQEFIASELPVEEVVYIAEGDRLLACSLPPDAPELVDLTELELIPVD
jgi:Tfp pilus assembly protein PilZ